jgi:two-component system, LytTR family, sensor kinase
MKIFSTPLRIAHVTIHGFALAHALVAAIIISRQSDPGIILTILTIAMIIILTRVNDYPLDVTAALALICCLGGFFLGTNGAIWISSLFSVTDDNSQIITTFFVTELLGWITYLIVRAPRKKSE